MTITDRAIDDASLPIARQVYGELADRIVPQPVNRGLPHLGEVLALAAGLRDAGYSVGDQLKQIDAINEATERMVTATYIGGLPSIDLATADPEEIAEQVRQVGLNQAARESIARAQNFLRQTLATAGVEHVRAESDRIVREMRKRFNPAVKVVQVAAEHGLTQYSSPAHLLDSAPAQVIDAYRELGPAVAELDAIAGLRNALTSLAGVGPAEHLMAAYLEGPVSEIDLEGAQNVWTGESEVVQRNLPLTGTHLARVRRERLGGPWLALVNAGYRLRLNTGAEAHALVNTGDCPGFS